MVEYTETSATPHFLFVTDRVSKGLASAVTKNCGGLQRLQCGCCYKEETNNSHKCAISSAEDLHKQLPGQTSCCHSEVSWIQLSLLDINSGGQSADDMMPDLKAQEAAGQHKCSYHTFLGTISIILAVLHRFCCLFALSVCFCHIVILFANTTSLSRRISSFYLSL